MVGRGERAARVLRTMLVGVVPVLAGAGVVVAIGLVPVGPPATVTVPVGQAGHPVTVMVPVAAPSTAHPATATTASPQAAPAAQRSSTTTPPSPASPKGATVVYTCDLNGPPVFGNPANPDEITNRACGYLDGQGRERSRDPWIDGQLTGRPR
ncbi:hypothetical protein [Pseudonocardia acidicola]|uniref:Uncharacterized protein n=1 Tax=Pseudonocardia acidicola TaxID=2724939 RepID=A0ABX1SMJ5_9PSEU|nr:hypothetical protein [Pseudonocardia acidicola]NMI01642.1 hypothetical protein [Pseudonocardia acidicola]